MSEITPHHAIRAAALEEAARVCDQLASQWGMFTRYGRGRAAAECAQRIRALKQHDANAVAKATR